MADEAATEEPKKKKKLMAIIPAVILLLGVVGGVYFMTAGKSKAAANPNKPTTTTTIAEGKVVRLAPLTVNLLDGHVLKVGIALQFVEKPKNKEIAGVLAGGGEGAAKPTADSPLMGEESKALDEAIHSLGNMTYEELSKPDAKLKAKDELGKKISDLYKGDVTEVYFTTFVMS